MNFYEVWRLRHQETQQPQQTTATRPPLEKLWTKDFILLAILNIFVFMTANMLMTTFPFYVRHLGGSDFLVGLILTIYSTASLLMRPIAGWCLDNISRKQIFYIGLCGLIAFPLLYLLVPILMVVVIGRCVHGLFWSVCSTSANTNACDIIPKSRFGEGLGYFGLTYSMAMALAPAFGIIIMEKAGFTVMFLCASAFALIALVMLTRVKLHPLPPKTTTTANIPAKARLAKLFNREALPASLLALCFSIPYASLSSFLALYAAADGLGNGGLYFTLNALSAAALRVFSGRIADTKGESLPIYFGCAAHFLALLFLAFGHSSLLFYLSGILVGISTGFSMPAMQTMSVRIVPLSQRGSASSTYLCSFDVATILGGVISGALATFFNYRVMFGLMAIPIALTAILYFFWGSKTKSAFRVAMQQNA